MRSPLFRVWSVIALLVIALGSLAQHAAAVQESNGDKGTPGPASATGHPDLKDSDCPEWFLNLQDFGAMPGQSYGDVRMYFRISPGEVAIDHADAGIRWQNYNPVADLTWKSDTALSMTYTPDPDGSIRNWGIVNTGPGLVSAHMGASFVVLVSSKVCDVPEMLKAWVRVQGGQNFGVGDIYPQTADIDNDNLADDTHCGNICNKDQDAAVESEQNTLRVKICYQLDKVKDAEAFKACKKSGNLAIGAREGRGWKCWYKTNQNGWVGPTAPENAPNQPSGAAYAGNYYGDCGYYTPPRPTFQAPRPTPSCTNGVSISQTTGAITCDSGTGSVHILSDEPWVPTTPVALATPYPILQPELYVYPDEATQGDTFTVEWANVPNPTSTDLIAVFDATTGVEPDSNHGQTRRWTDNCAKTTQNHGSTSTANGSCAVPVDAHLPQGTYEFRLYHGSVSSGNLVVTSNSWVRTPSYCELNPGQCSE